MFTVSGVTLEAAMMRSPSFSRPSSSVTTTSPPAAIAWIAVSTVSKDGRLGMTKGWQHPPRATDCQIPAGSAPESDIVIFHRLGLVTFALQEGDMHVECEGRQYGL